MSTHNILFSLRNKKNNMWIPPLICSYVRGASHIIFILFLHENIFCGYSLEAPCQGTSDYTQHIFSWRNKKNVGTFLFAKVLYLRQ